jgi:hypothetical protein
MHAEHANGAVWLIGRASPALICAKFFLAPQRHKARNAGRDRTRSRAPRAERRSTFPGRLPPPNNPPHPLVLSRFIGSSLPITPRPPPPGPPQAPTAHERQAPTPAALATNAPPP